MSTHIFIYIIIYIINVKRGMSKDVAVFGAGWAGLTVAFELAKRGYKVTVYEKDLTVGGMAKSKRTPNGVPTEHSWRGYAPFYYNLFSLLKEIPVESMVESFSYPMESMVESFSYPLSQVQEHNTASSLWTYYNGNVYDITKWVPLHPGGQIILKAGGQDLQKTLEKYGLSWHLSNQRVLSNLEKYRIGKLADDTTEHLSSPSLFDTALSPNRLQFRLLSNTQRVGINALDYPFLIYNYLKCAVTDKRKSDYYKVRFLDVITDKVSRGTYNYLVHFISGPGFGFDYNTISFAHHSSFVERTFEKGFGSWKVASGPTSEAIFQPMVHHLEKLGVKFEMGTELISIASDQNKTITQCVVRKDLVTSTVIADHYCICVNPNTLVDVFATSDPIYTQFQGLKTINNQLGFVITFNTNIQLPDNSAYVLIDSPLNITFYPQGQYWTNTTNKNLGNSVKSIWSGTCVQLGNAVSKTKDALKKEILEQVFQSTGLNSDLRKLNPNINVKASVIDVIIYDEWSSDIKAKNPKWVNNISNENFRPHAKTIYSNMTLGGAHCKTSTTVWSMEGAVESGKLAAQEILRTFSDNRKVNVHTFQSILPIRLLQNIDNILYDKGLPHVIDLSILLLVVWATLQVSNR